MDPKPPTDMEWLMLLLAQLTGELEAMQHSQLIRAEERGHAVDAMRYAASNGFYRPTLVGKLNHGLLTDLPKCEERAQLAQMRTQARGLIKRS